MSWLPWVNQRRRELRNTPFTASESQMLDENVPMRRRLSPEQREKLDGLTRIFVHEKSFEGCGGLELTEDMVLTIATQACVLLVGLDTDVPYRGLDVLRIYPSAYRTPDEEPVRLGESSRRGWIVLAWDHALSGARNPDDGQNVVLHEFAHQLDTEDGAADGAPVLPRRSLYEPWARVLGHDFAELQKTVEAGGKDVLRAYGATSPAEFFAVATEAFFERGPRVKSDHPELYAMLQAFYLQDPASWDVTATG